MKTHYEVLEVSEKASPEMIKHAYRLLMNQYHPDRNPGNQTALELSQLVTVAYGVLIDPDKRLAYDIHLAKSRRKTTEFPGAAFRGAQPFDFGDFGFSSGFVNSYPEHIDQVQTMVQNASRDAMSAMGNVFMESILAQMSPAMRDVFVRGMATAQAAKAAKAKKAG